jgi:superfamily I DNA and RNA helicase
MFDYALLDEGQDFPTHFYKLCRMITREDRISWGYDECQNILNVELQDERETFGKDEHGKYYIDFRRPRTDEKQDLILHICYRNPRRILVIAFALGLGLYSDRIIQMPENNAHWEDLGFCVLEGDSNVGDTMVIERPKHNSPLVMDKHLENDDVVRMRIFDSVQEERNFVADSIQEDLDNDLRPDDILVICTDDHYARDYFRRLACILRSKDISVFNLLEAPSNVTEFQIDDCVTLTTVYRAKGNESGSVYVMGVDYVFRNKHSIKERNKLFTAITRSKAWVTLTGIGENARECETEVKLALENYPHLRFTMPDRDSLKMFQRGLTQSQAAFNQLERQLQDIATQLGIPVEDVVERFRKPRKG